MIDVFSFFMAICIWHFFEWIFLYVKKKWPKKIIYRYRYQDKVLLQIYSLPRDQVNLFFSTNRILNNDIRIRADYSPWDSTGHVKPKEVEISGNILLNNQVLIEESQWNEFLKEIGEKPLQPI